MVPVGLPIEIGLTLAVTVGALVLFMWNRIRMDVVGIIVMVTLIVLGLVTPQEGISGFSNEAMITVAAMFVLSAGLVRTGAVDIMGRWMARVAGKSELRLLVVVLLFAIPVSAFINNTPVVIVLLPVVIGICRDIGVAPSRLLMPLSFGSQMGGTLTLIGTSTNLLVAGLVLDLGLERIRIFDITPPALILMLVGVTYLLTVGRWLTPERESTADLVSTYELRDYLTGLIVEQDSGLVGRTLAETRFEQTFGMQIVAIERAGARITFPSGSSRIRAGDLLVVRANVPDITRIAANENLRISGTTPDLPGEEDGSATPDAEHPLAEVIVPPRGRVIGRTLRDVGFRARYGLNVLAIKRHGEPQHEPIGGMALEAGDILLVQGPAEALNELHKRGDFALVGAVDLPTKRTRKIKYALPIMAAVVLLAFLEITTILVSSMMGVVAMFLTGCIKPDEAYRDVDWMVLVLLGSIIPLGLAMQNTGTAAFLATGLVGLTLPLGLLGALATFYLLTSLLTEIISNNASAVVLTPIAIATGIALDVSPLPFVIAVMIAASNSFMTPIGYQTNTFIYGPGGYRFSDYLRVGGPLGILLLIVATFVIPIFFPF